MNIKTCIGIDVSKPFLDCYAIPANKSKQFANSSSGIKACLKWICNHSNIHRIVLEPTGGYEKNILKELQEKDLPAALVNARYIHHFGIAQQDKAKTDALDAMTLAAYGDALSPRITKSTAPSREKLKALVDRRKTLQNACLAEKNRLEKKPLPVLAKSISRSIKFLDKEIKALDIAIADLLKHPDLIDACKLLTQTKGIGL